MPTSQCDHRRVGWAAKLREQAICHQPGSSRVGGRQINVYGSTAQVRVLLREHGKQSEDGGPQRFHDVGAFDGLAPTRHHGDLDRVHGASSKLLAEARQAGEPRA